MDNGKLTKISLTISLLGTFILLLLSEFTHPPLIKTNEITDNFLDTKVKIQGTLISIKETPGLYLLNVKDSNKVITAVVFKDSNLEIKKGDLIEIEGTIQKYKETLEITADKITLLK